GLPDAMRRRAPAYDDRAPLRVFVDLTSSLAISPQILARRGTAHLALAMFLANERPVELYACVILGQWAALDAGALVVPIPAQPLDLAVACNALTSPAFARYLSYSLVKANYPGYDGTWSWHINPSNDNSRARYAARAREALGLGPDDVYAPPAYV